MMLKIPNFNKAKGLLFQFSLAYLFVSSPNLISSLTIPAAL